MKKQCLSVTPYLVVKDGHKAIKFYQQAFGAVEMEHHETPDGKIMHSRMQIGNSSIMLSDEFSSKGGGGVHAPASLKGTSVMLHIHVEDVDTAFNQAIKSGAKVIMPVEDMFWGDRYGQLEDPFGHIWSLATPIEKLQTSSCHNHKCCGGH